MVERKKLRKVFYAWDFEKEEQWLNAMAQSGWLLDEVGFCVYYFVPCQPGEYTIRLEMREQDEAYINFMAETGAEYLGRVVKWIYFRKHIRYGPFDIFSDIDSRIAHLKKIAKMLAGAGGANLIIGIGNSLNPVLAIGWINLLCATFLMYSLGRFHGKLEALERDRSLME